jgi:phosphate transport system protein
MTLDPVDGEIKQRPTELRLEFHDQLDAIRTDVVRLAAMVTECITRGTDVLLSGDLAGAQQLIDDDDELDVLSLHIEERCYQVLTLEGPMAGDLRSLITALRLVSELERSGDLMVNVCKAMRRIYGTEIDPKPRGLIARMAEEAGRLMRMAIDAYDERDEGKAAALDDMDDRLDALHKQYIQAIFLSNRAGNLDIEAGVQLALIGRYYERIGDHAVNIGERVRYLVTGWVAEQKGAVRYAERQAASDLE